MSESVANPMGTNPFAVLGVADDANEATIRARYLELVKEFPPDREPDRFREIQAAYKAASDPLVLAQRMLEGLIGSEDPPSWQAVIDDQASRPPQMTPEFLLSLGNRGNARDSAAACSVQTDNAEEP